MHHLKHWSREGYRETGKLLAAWHDHAMLRQKNVNSAPLLWARLAQAFLLFLPPFSQPLCLPAWSFHIQNKAACTRSCICSNRDTCFQQCQPFAVCPLGGLLQSCAAPAYIYHHLLTAGQVKVAQFTKHSFLLCSKIWAMTVRKTVQQSTKVPFPWFLPFVLTFLGFF